jgi:hypothetical protein
MPAESIGLLGLEPILLSGRGKVRSWRGQTEAEHEEAKG